MEDKIHTGHRSRLRSRALESRLDGFEEYQILELLLTYTIPQKDTNPIAHNLIKEFGSLSGVLDADINDLVKVKGISEYSASFLILLKDVFRKYKQSLVKDIVTIKNTSEALVVCKSELEELSNEAVLIICLDNSNKVVLKKIISVGFSNATTIPFRKIVDLVVKTNTNNIIIAHNHPLGLATPSSGDDIATKNLVFSLSLSGVRILDSIIIGEDDSYSYFVSGKLSDYYKLIENNQMYAFNQSNIKYEK